MGPGGFQNGKLMSPLAQDAYNQHQQQLSPNAPPRPPKIKDDTVEDPPTPSKKKHRERDENGEKIRKPKRTEEEKQKRREKKERRDRERELGGSPASRKKSRDMLSPDAEEVCNSGVISSWNVVTDRALAYDVGPYTLECI
jgi:hypothetical protein